jgi:NADPH-dependent ferric siderophore reductase
VTRPPMSAALLHVVDTAEVTPHMRRITFGGDGLTGFTPVAPDQQLKLFFARDGGVPEVPEPEPDGDVMRWYQRYLAVPEPVRPWMRTYTVRRHDARRRQLEIDFVLHADNEGPASRFAARARAGDVVGMYGPSVSHFRRPGGHAWRLLVGDETALPAIGATLESLPAGERAVVYAEVADAGEEQRFTSAADVEVHWLHRGTRPPGGSTQLLDVVRTAELPDGPAYAWVAGEASAVRAVRRHLVGERAVARRAVAFAGYWRLQLSQDDAPTAEEVAEQDEYTSA